MVISILIGVFCHFTVLWCNENFIYLLFFKGLKSPPESLSDLGAIESLRVPGKVLIYMCERDFTLP